MLTPGPWRFHERSGSVEGEHSTFGISAPAPYHWVIPPLNIELEDARVLSAAKELFEAAQLLMQARSLHMTHRNAKERDAYVALNKAIQKAIGLK